MDISIIVGLGNPGPAYVNTRHNIGFRVVDRLAALGGWPWTPGETYDRAMGAIDGASVMLVRPRTFMNRSGSAVARALFSSSAPPEGVLVVVDDIDLPLGRLRLRRSGGPGTHNGLRDITAAVGESFPRLRIGVRDTDIEGDLATYVLEEFDHTSADTLNRVIDLSVEAARCTVTEGVTVAMNTFNGQRIDRPDADRGEP